MGKGRSTFESFERSPFEIGDNKLDHGALLDDLSTAPPLEQVEIAEKLKKQALRAAKLEIAQVVQTEISTIQRITIDRAVFSKGYEIALMHMPGVVAWQVTQRVNQKLNPKIIELVYNSCQGDPSSGVHMYFPDLRLEPVPVYYD